MHWQEPGEPEEPAEPAKPSIPGPLRGPHPMDPALPLLAIAAGDGSAGRRWLQGASQLARQPAQRGAPQSPTDSGDPASGAIACRRLPNQPVPPGVCNGTGPCRAPHRAGLSRGAAGHQGAGRGMEM